MNDKSYMYGTDHDPDKIETEKTQSIAESGISGRVLIESQGKKIEVVSAKEYDRLVIELKDTQKQVKILKTEFQNFRKFVNSVAKTASHAQTIADKINDRFN